MERHTCARPTTTDEASAVGAGATGPAVRLHGRPDRDTHRRGHGEPAVSAPRRLDAARPAGGAADGSDVAAPTGDVPEPDGPAEAAAGHRQPHARRRDPVPPE